MRLVPILAVVLLAASCAKREGEMAASIGPQHVTVLTRDGNRYTGRITSSSPTQVTLTGDDSATHTLAMKDVKSINYDDAAPAAPSPTGAPAAASAPPPPPPAPEASREEHSHPE